MDAKKACLAHGINLKVEKDAHREYQKYEFCKAVGCMGKSEKNKCNVDSTLCIHTAKEFHHWLTENGFEIVKKLYKPAG